MSFKVLVVEDDPMVSMINCQFVGKNPDFTVAGSCRNGQEALEFLKENQVDLIMLDVYMPVMSGTETLKKIREMKIDAEVIMVTAANDTETIGETMHLGVLDYLIKPFTFERFNVSLEKFVAQRKLIKENTVMDQSCLDSLITASKSSGNEIKTAGTSEATGNLSDRTNSVEASPAFENLPKGIQKRTLELFLDYFSKNSSWNSVDVIAETLGISIVTVRNYMNFLAKEKYVSEDINYSTGGRPSMMYKRN